MLVLSLIAIFISLGLNAQVVKKKDVPKPDPIEEFLPEQPSPYHKWDEGRWRWKKKVGAWVWMDGKWRIDDQYLYRTNNYYSRLGYGYSPYSFGYGFGYPIFFRNNYLIRYRYG